MNGIKEIPILSIKHRYVELFSPESANKTVLLSHFGNLSENKVSSILKITEETILDLGSKRQVMRRVCSLLVEALQNISNHSGKDKDGKSQSFFILEHTPSTFNIKTGNLVAVQDLIALEQKLNSINRLNENELRKLYIETLCNDSFNQKGGAGLGFLTMAKKINGTLDYEILNVDKSFSYFSLSLSIPYSN